jgi:hypothetical protein
MDVQCGADEACLLTKGTCDPDAFGTCVGVPKVCSDDLLKPVCGCDGVTYDNACAALRAGVEIDRPGSCVSIP